MLLDHYTIGADLAARFWAVTRGRMSPKRAPGRFAARAMLPIAPN
jgi:hypothetical protein